MKATYISLLVVSILVLGAAIAPARADSPVERITVDFSNECGRIRAIHGVNGGPVSNGENPDLSGWFKEAGFSTVRLHDCHWPCPDVVDIHTIFPLAHLDPDDPANYTFSKTDDYIAGIHKTGAKILWRLGESIEIKGTKYHINPPQDMDKFARVCVNIMKHYNEGWANGYRYNIEYWEIWNEPESGRMWTATMEELFTLYGKVARAIKTANPKLKVGGLAFTRSAFKETGWARPFIKYCREHDLPLDFLSFHYYTPDPMKVIGNCREARKLLDEYGFKNTETHLNEFRYYKDSISLRPRDPEEYVNVPARFDVSTDATGTAYAIGMLIRLQDERVDMSNYYSADTSSWSMFGQFGIRRPVFHGYRAFNELAKRPLRVKVQVEGDTETPSCVLAGIAEEKLSAAVLFSTFNGKSGTRAITLTHLPWKGETRVETLLVDGTHALTATPAIVDGDANGTKRITVNLASNVVCLVRLSQALKEDKADSGTKP